MAILRTGSTIGVAIHHSVYKQANNLEELKAQAKLFNGWHKTKSWAEATKTPSEYPYISYHYLMATDGSILNVTDEKYVKYHSGDNFRGDNSFNLHGIGICLTGNYENDIPTEAMMKSLVLFIRDFQKRYKIDALVRGHKETSQSATACPGKNIGTSKSGWLKQVISNTNDKNYPPAPATPPDVVVPPSEVEILKNKIAHLELIAEARLKQVDMLEIQRKELQEANEQLNRYKEYFEKLSILLETKI